MTDIVFIVTDVAIINECLSSLRVIHNLKIICALVKHEHMHPVKCVWETFLKGSKKHEMDFNS